jgi:hypothetical protein
MANLAGWPYWKDISIAGQAGAGTDYQVELEIGDSAGGDFHLEGHCTNFPQDIRITDDDGTTLLDHWVEDLTADPIVVHVEVKDDLGSNQTIRVYYGKSGETTASNGANTFVQYHGVSTATYCDSLVLASTTHFIWESYAKNNEDGKLIRQGVGNQASYTGQDCFSIYRGGSADIAYLNARDEGGSTYVSEAMTVTSNVFYNWKMTFDGTTFRGYVNDNQISSGVTSGFPNENMGLFMSEDEVDEGNGEQKYSFVRKYNATEPAFSSAGAEQTPGVGAAPTGVFYGPLVGPFGGPI